MENKIAADRLSFWIWNCQLWGFGKRSLDIFFRCLDLIYSPTVWSSFSFLSKIQVGSFLHQEIRILKANMIPLLRYLVTSHFENGHVSVIWNQSMLKYILENILKWLLLGFAAGSLTDATFSLCISLGEFSPCSNNPFLSFHYVLEFHPSAHFHFFGSSMSKVCVCSNPNQKRGRDFETQFSLLFEYKIGEELAFQIVMHTSTARGCARASDLERR